MHTDSLGATRQKLLAPKHVKPGLKAGARSVTCRHLHKCKPNAPARACLCVFVRVCVCNPIVSYCCVVAGGTGPDVASGASLEVRPRRSGGLLGPEKPFPPRNGVFGGEGEDALSREEFLECCPLIWSQPHTLSRSLTLPLSFWPPLLSALSDLF